MGAAIYKYAESKYFIDKYIKFYKNCREFPRI